MSLLLLGSHISWMLPRVSQADWELGIHHNTCQYLSFFTLSWVLIRFSFYSSSSNHLVDLGVTEGVRALIRHGNSHIRLLIQFIRRCLLIASKSFSSFISTNYSFISASCVPFLKVRHLLFASPVKPRHHFPSSRLCVGPLWRHELISALYFLLIYLDSPIG